MILFIVAGEPQLALHPLADVPQLARLLPVGIGFVCGAPQCGHVLRPNLTDLSAARRAHQKTAHPDGPSFVFAQCLAQPGQNGQLVCVSGGLALGSAYLTDSVRASTPHASAPANPSQTEFYSKENMWLCDHKCVPHMQVLQLPNLRASAELFRPRTPSSPAIDLMEASILTACEALVERMQGILGVASPVFCEQLVQVGGVNASGFRTAPLRPLEESRSFTRGMQDLVLFLYRWQPNTVKLSLQWWDPASTLDVAVQGVARALHALALESLQDLASSRSVAWSFIRAQCVKVTARSASGAVEECELRPPAAAQRAGAQALRAMRYGTAYLAIACKDGVFASRAAEAHLTREHLLTASAACAQLSLLTWLRVGSTARSWQCWMWCACPARPRSSQRRPVTAARRS
jgi:hypothetical protein